MRYKLVQEYDRISRQLSWIGLDRPKDEAELGPVHGDRPGFGAEVETQSSGEIAYFKTKPSTDRHQVASTASDQLL